MDIKAELKKINKKKVSKPHQFKGQFQDCTKHNLAKTTFQNFELINIR